MIKIAHPRRLLTGLLLALITLGLDQYSKCAFVEALRGQEPMEIFPFFDLVLVWNYGISFGMLAGRNLPMLLTLGSGIIVLILLGWLARTPSKLVGDALGLVIGGALGNMLDRVRYGAVADFLDFHLGEHHWPAFNIADSAIFIGVVLLCAHSMFIEQHNKGNPAT